MLTATTMTDQKGMLRLMAWLSPVFPTGGFAYSSGLETAVDAGLVHDRASLQNWLETKLDHGAIRNDAILLAEAWRGCRDGERLTELSELALAMSGSRERHLELTAQAEAFSATIGNWPDLADLQIPQPSALFVAVGAAAGFAGIDLRQSLIAYLHSVVSTQVQAAIRLSILGQTAAAQILANLEPGLSTLAETSQSSTTNDLGSATIGAEIMAMNHEHLQGRMFRS